MAGHGINQIVERIEKRAEELARDVDDEVVVAVPASGEFDGYDVVLDAYDFRTALFVIQWARAQGGKNRKPRPASSRPVTDHIVALIRDLDGDGLSQHRIASELNVNQGRINEVLKGE
jgi:hypothetical protein